MSADNLPQATTGPHQLPDPLPEKWVARIFDHMAALYGKRFLSLWQDTDLQVVKAMWAAKLAPYRAHKGEAIAMALDALDSVPNPPTLPEFIRLCSDAFQRVAERHKPTALERKPTPEEREQQRQMAEQVAQTVKKPKGCDAVQWARRPMSQLAMNMVADAAKHPMRYPQLAAVFDELVEQGVCTAAGKLLKRWDGQQWVKA